VNVVMDLGFCESRGFLDQMNNYYTRTIYTMKLELWERCVMKLLWPI
jgi:hypothetical protein